MTDHEAAIEGIAPPHGDGVRAAWELCAGYCSEPMTNHSLRSYYWAAAHAEAQRLSHDRELLFVAAALHDIALTPWFDSHLVAFEEAGAQVARVFAAGAGWSLTRRDHLAEVIILHMRDDVSAAQDAESHLLQIGVTADVSGGGLASFDPAFTAALLHRFPRAGFGGEFIRLLREQASRKPDSAAAQLLQAGAEPRILGNPLGG